MSLVEVMIAVAIGTALLGVAYGVLTSGSRIQARAGSKLAAAEEAELVFRRLGQDLAAAADVPKVVTSSISSTDAHGRTVTWSFVSGGTDSGVERVDPDGHRTLHLQGRLVEFQLAEAQGKPEDTGNRTTVALSLTARGPQDVDPAGFAATFSIRAGRSEPEWNTLARAPAR